MSLGLRGMVCDDFQLKNKRWLCKE